MTDYFVNNEWTEDNPSISWINPSASGENHPRGYKYIEYDCYNTSTSDYIISHNPIFSNSSTDDPVYIVSALDNRIIGVYIISSVIDNRTIQVDREIGLNNNEIVLSYQPEDGLSEEFPFPTFQYAVKNISPTGDTLWIKKNNGYRFDNLDQFAPDASGNVPLIDIDITGGDWDTNTHSWIKGYNIDIGDMDIDGDYYLGSKSGYQNYNDWTMDFPNGELVTFDANGWGSIGGNNDFIHIDGCINLQIENIYFKNMNNIYAANMLEHLNSARVHIKNCRFGKAGSTGHGIAGSLDYGVVQDCFFEPNIKNGINVSTGKTIIIDNCIFNNSNFAINQTATYSTSLITNNLFIDNETASIRVKTTSQGFAIIKNNTFITTKTLSISASIVTAGGPGVIQYLQCYNNIAYYFEDEQFIYLENASINEVDFNCIYKQNGTVSTPYSSTNYIGNNNIEEEPNFIDYTLSTIKSNYISQNINCYTGGKKDIYKNINSMGINGFPALYFIIHNEPEFVS